VGLLNPGFFRIFIYIFCWK